MPIYVMLTNLTEKGVKTIREKPGRIKEVNKEGEPVRVKVLSQYSLLGPYDFISIIEAPNDAVMTNVAVQLGSRGTVRTLTMPALSTDDFLAAVKTSKD
ncbi:MAG: GYD domain-containing protein [Chloroflexota bacterium]